MVRLACKQRLLVIGPLVLCLLLAGLLPPPQPALAAPTVSLPDPSGPTGTLKVKATGGGWPTGDYLEIRWSDGRLIGQTISPVDAAGNFTTVFSIPEDATPGNYSVLFRDTTNTSISAAATFTVTIPTMSLQPSSGPIGTTITATGSGWPGQKDIEVNWDGTNFLTSAYADTAGNVAIPFAVPDNTTLGGHQVQFMFSNGNFPVEVWKTFTVTAAPPPFGSCVTDDFSTSSLAANWTWIDPLHNSSYSLTAKSGNLRIHTSTGEHDLHPGYNTNAPRLAQSITGDFDVSIKVTINPIQGGYQAAGLFMWFDENNLLWIGRSVDDAIGHLYVRAGQDLSPPAVSGVTATTVYLRLTRGGNTFTTYYSLDGATWTQAGSLAYPSAASTTLVGMFLINQWQDNPISADFDYFHCRGASSTSSISGRVVDANNTGIAGVTMQATGPTNKSATTDPNGNYILSGLAAGAYTITPSKSGYTFSPSSLPITVPPDATGKNFTGRTTSSSSFRVFLPITTRSIDVVRITTDPQAQNEPTITHDPNNPNILVAGANDFRQKNASNLFVPRCGWYFSAQAGKDRSWTERVFDPPTAFNPKFDAGADPAVGIDGKHNVYYSCLAFNAAGRANTAKVVELVTGIFVYKGQIVNGSLKWYAVPIEVISDSAQAANEGKDIHSGKVYDKPYLAADSISGKVYVSWSRGCRQISGGLCSIKPFGVQTQRILIAGLAADGTFSNPRPTVISDDTPIGTAYNAAVPAIAKNGTVYVAWHDDHANRILIDRSTDGGKNWGADQEVATNADSFPTLGVDPTNSDVVYAAWTSGGNILFKRCTYTPSFTCLPQQKVNDEPSGEDTEQSFPWMSVAPNGKIAIVYYNRTDARNDSQQTKMLNMDVYVATSTDKGDHFPKVKVTDMPTNQYNGASVIDGSPFYGDYIGITVDNSTMHPIWTAGFNKNQDIYTTVIK